MNKKVTNFLAPKNAFEKIFLFGFLYLFAGFILSEIFPLLGREFFNAIPFLSVSLILYCLLFTFNYVVNVSIKFLKSAVISEGGVFVSVLYLIAGVSGLGTSAIVGWRAFQSPVWERPRRLFENYLWHDYAFWACGLLDCM